MQHHGGLADRATALLPKQSMALPHFEVPAAERLDRRMPCSHPNTPQTIGRTNSGLDRLPQEGSFATNLQRHVLCL
jgi:hypothetical protein